MIKYTTKQLDAALLGISPYNNGIDSQMTKAIATQLRDALAKNEIDKITMDNFLKRIAKLEATIERVKALSSADKYPYDRKMSSVHYEAYTAGYNHGRTDAAIEREITLQQEQE
jgi:hypothetical protein